MSERLKALSTQAHQQRENYIAALTEVAVEALRGALVTVKEGGRGEQELHDAIETIVSGY